MPHSIAAATIAGTIMLGSALGVCFGRSAVSQVDPKFYRIYDDYHSFAQYSAAHAEYAPEAAGMGTEPIGCVGCESLGDGRPPWLRSTIFSDADLGLTPVPVAVEGVSYEAPEALYSDAAPVPEERTAPQIERYAHYAVDATERPVVTSEAASPPQAADAPEPVGM
ncbi:MAG TPA: hypothetical protein VI381_05430 [Allosphingosinicella sp.]